MVTTIRQWKTDLSLDIINYLEETIEVYQEDISSRKDEVNLRKAADAISKLLADRYSITITRRFIDDL